MSTSLHSTIVIRAFENVPADYFKEGDDNILSKLQFKNPEESSSNTTFTSTSFLILAVNLNLVLNEFHLQNAIHKAYFQQQNGSMKTKYLSTEIFYHLSNSGKFVEAINQFSIKVDTQHLAVLFLPLSLSISSEKNELVSEDDLVKKEFDSICNTLQQSGQEFPPADISQLLTKQENKKELLKKAFKLSPKEMESIETSILTKLAVKDLLN